MLVDKIIHYTVIPTSMLVSPYCPAEMYAGHVTCCPWWFTVSVQTDGWTHRWMLDHYIMLSTRTRQHNNRRLPINFSPGTCFLPPHLISTFSVSVFRTHLKTYIFTVMTIKHSCSECCRFKKNIFATPSHSLTTMQEHTAHTKQPQLYIAHSV